MGLRVLLYSLLLAAAASSDASADHRRFITLATTTSAEESGLLGYLLPAFTAKTGIAVHAAPVGTGQALKIGQRGECDVLLVHDRARELDFVRNGDGSVRREFMYGDFIVVGPRDDPAQIAGMRDVVAALRKIAEAKSPFVSRADLSGTDAAEKRFWAAAGVDPLAYRGLWYVETGSGMAQALATAAMRNGYTLADRPTWAAFSDRRDLKILLEGDPRLKDQYSVLLVNPARHPQVKADLGTAFIDWLTSPEGQDAIAGYKVGGEQVYFPDAKP